jgi:hypothetical protein
MHGGLTGFGAHPSLGGLLLGGAPPKGRKGFKGGPKRPALYSKKGVAKKEAPGANIFYTSDLAGDIKEMRKEAKRVATEQRKRLRQTPGYKMYVKQYQNFLKDIAKNRLQHLTAEETVAIEQAIEMGHGADIPYMIADRDQHIRMLKAKHFPMWAAKEYTFDLHKPKKYREFHMAPYTGMREAIMPEMVETVEQHPELGLVPVSVPRYAYSSSSIPRPLSMSSSGLGINLPRRMGRVRNERGQYVSPESEEFLENVQIVPY